MTTPVHKNNQAGLNTSPDFAATTELLVSTCVSSIPELEPAVELSSAAPVAGQSPAQVYEQLTDFIYETLARTHGITLDKTPNTYRIITNLLLLAVEERQKATPATSISAAVVSTMLKIGTDEEYRNQLIAQSTERASVEFWTIDYPSLAGNAGGQALTFVCECLQTLLHQPQPRTTKE